MEKGTHMKEEKQVIDMANFLYTTYCEEVGGFSFKGDLLPTWDIFYSDKSKAKQSTAWVNTARRLIRLGD